MGKLLGRRSGAGAAGRADGSEGRYVRSNTELPQLLIASLPPRAALLSYHLLLFGLERRLFPFLTLFYWVLLFRCPQASVATRFIGNKTPLRRLNPLFCLRYGLPAPMTLCLPVLWTRFHKTPAWLTAATELEERRRPWWKPSSSGTSQAVSLPHALVQVQDWTSGKVPRGDPWPLGRPRGLVEPLDGQQLMNAAHADAPVAPHPARVFTVPAWEGSGSQWAVECTLISPKILRTKKCTPTL